MPMRQEWFFTKLVIKRSAAGHIISYSFLADNLLFSCCYCIPIISFLFLDEIHLPIESFNCFSLLNPSSQFVRMTYKEGQQTIHENFVQKQLY